MALKVRLVDEDSKEQMGFKEIEGYKVPARPRY